MTANNFDSPGPLMVETIKRLKDKELLIIYSDTKIPYHWLTKFAAGKIKNPSVNRVEFLNNYLKDCGGKNA